jgi:Uma2 family endonuclease
MLATSQDLIVLSVEDFERLPEDGIFEVVDGRAVLMPGNDIPHQDVVMGLYEAFRSQLRRLGRGYVLPTINVFIPRPAGSLGEVQNRVPDLVVASRKPHKRFEAGQAPELVIEVLSSRRGNVERTEKLDDYAAAGIGEYWIVNPFDRVIDVYRLSAGEFIQDGSIARGTISPSALPGVVIDLSEIWAVSE